MTPVAPPRWRRIAWRLLGAVFMIALVAALATALAGQDWTVVAEAVAARPAGQSALIATAALLTITIGLALGLLSWRSILLDLGPPVGLAQTIRIFLIYFLSKYLPWRPVGLVATARVAATSGVGMGRLLNTMAISLIVVVLTGGTVGLLAGAATLGGHAALLLVPAGLTALLVARPRLVNLLARMVTRLLRRPAPAAAVTDRGMRVALAAQALSWLVSGLHLWLLAVGMGAPPARSLMLCVGAFGLATVAGVLAVVVPDGIGVREAVLMAALVTVLPLPSALVVTLASRLVSTASEVVLGGAALAAAELAHRRSPPEQDPAPATEEQEASR